MTLDQIFALITALATLAAVFFAWRAATAAKDSVTVAEKAAMRLAGPARHYGLDLLKYAIGADSGPTLAT